MGLAGGRRRRRRRGWPRRAAGGEGGNARWDQLGAHRAFAAQGGAVARHARAAASAAEPALGDAPVGAAVHLPQGGRGGVKAR